MNLLSLRITNRRTGSDLGHARRNSFWNLAMTDYRIDSVNKPDRFSPHEHITHVAGPKPDGSGRWRDSVSNVVAFVENKQHRFYTQEGNAFAWVGVKTSAAGHKFLQTYADGVWKDNLLALPECS